MKDKKTENSKPQPQVMVGGWRGTRNRKKLWYVVGASGLLLVLAVLVYLLFFQKGPYADVEDPRPDLIADYLSKEEADQRLQSRFGMSIEDVRKKGIDTSRIKSFADAIAVTQILRKHELYGEVTKSFARAEKIGSDNDKDIAFYAGYYIAACEAKDKELLERLFSKRKDMFSSRTDVDTESIEYSIDEMQKVHNSCLEYLKTEGQKSEG